jgi:serpin B
MEKDLPLDSVLQSLGMTDMYSPSSSDLSGINGIKGDLFVSSAKHKAVVEVNEEGTEAAAVTGIMLKTMAFHPPLNVRADRPFLFFIRGGSSVKDEKVVLFSGVFAKVP